MADLQDTQPADQWQIALDSLTTLSYRSRDFSRYLHEIACGVSRVLKSDWSIVTVHKGARGYVIASNLDIDETETGFSVHSSVSEVVIQSGQPFWIEDVRQYPEEIERMAGYVCYLGVPLRTLSGNIIGTICSFSVQPQHYSLEMIATVERFAERAATAIDNYQLYQQLQKFHDSLEAEVTKQTVELRTAQAKLIEYERLAAIGEFAAMIVHEIRNPLTTIQMGLEYFAKLALPRSAQARLSLAMDEAKRLADLLQEVLSYSKPQILQLSEINLHAFIQELLISLRAMPEAQGRSIEYIPCHSSTQILGDADKLKQVFINLIRNACEAVDPGDMIRWFVTDNQMEQIYISIHNGGTPIPTDVLPLLTQPFYSTKAEGIGLGLAIVKRIIEAHNGELLIESSESQGTIFSVKLPKN
ncbi:ATPase [filamentous cyanobacterium CCP2]|nr:ATPase [filamentous cyanobacterium CCP2]